MKRKVTVKKKFEGAARWKGNEMAHVKGGRRPKNGESSQEGGVQGESKLIKI